MEASSDVLEEYLGGVHVAERVHGRGVLLVHAVQTVLPRTNK